MNVDAADVVDVDLVKEEVEDVAVAEAEAAEEAAEEAEAEAEDKVTIPIHYLVHMKMKRLFLKLRYMIKVNTNRYPGIKKLKFKNSKARLVVSMDTLA